MWGSSAPWVVIYYLFLLTYVNMYYHTAKLQNECILNHTNAVMCLWVIKYIIKYVAIAGLHDPGLIVPNIISQPNDPSVLGYIPESGVVDVLGLVPAHKWRALDFYGMVFEGKLNVLSWFKSLQKKYIYRYFYIYIFFQFEQVNFDIFCISNPNMYHFKPTKAIVDSNIDFQEIITPLTLAFVVKTLVLCLLSLRWLYAGVV